MYVPAVDTRSCIVVRSVCKVSRHYNYQNLVVIDVGADPLMTTSTDSISLAQQEGFVALTAGDMEVESFSSDTDTASSVHSVGVQEDTEGEEGDTDDDLQGMVGDDNIMLELNSY